ncbi:hypothetical protein Tco_1297383, partial [Tanacetum coccineum]
MSIRVMSLIQLCCCNDNNFKASSMQDAIQRTFSALENGIASMSTPYWDIEDDDDCGKYTLRYLSLALKMMPTSHQNISLHDEKDLTFIGCVFVGDVVVLKDHEQSDNTTTFDAFPSNIPTFSPATCRWGNISPA